jgi:hypothetical protein
LIPGLKAHAKELCSLLLDYGADAALANSLGHTAVVNAVVRRLSSSWFGFFDAALLAG